MNSDRICPKCGRQEREANWDSVHRVRYASDRSGLCFDCAALVAEQVQVIINGPWIPEGYEWGPPEDPDEAA